VNARQPHASAAVSGDETDVQNSWTSIVSQLDSIAAYFQVKFVHLSSGTEADHESVRVSAYCVS
jgi:hypothetical protein